jgi:hypothetical protein
VPGECPTGRRSLAGGPRHPYKRLGSCWGCGEAPHAKNFQTLLSFKDPLFKAY